MIALELQSDGWLWLSNGQFNKLEIHDRKSLMFVSKYVENKKYAKKGKSFSVCKKTKKYIGIPRNKAITIFNNKEINIKNITLGTDVKLDILNIKLRDYQQSAVENVKKSYLNGKLGGILKMACGSGKTLTSLCCASMIGKKTLIVVNSGAAIIQWNNVIKSLFNNKIGILISRMSIETAKELISNNDIILTMHHALHKGKFKSIVFNEIGFVIIDEIHLYMTKTWIKMFYFISRRYILGLTATITRPDKLDYLIQWFVGDIVYRKDTCYNGKLPKVIMINYTGNKEITKIVKTKKYDIAYSQMITNTCKDKYRNQIITSNIEKIYNDKKSQTILVMAQRIQQLWYLYNLFKEKKYDVGIILGISSQTKEIKNIVEASYDKKLIFCSLLMGKQGLDIETTNRMILINSFKTKDHGKHSESLEQLTGRILRRKWEISPEIWIINDMTTFFINHYQLRLEYYLECGYKIEHRNYDEKGNYIKK